MSTVGLESIDHTVQLIYAWINELAIKLIEIKDWCRRPRHSFRVAWRAGIASWCSAPPLAGLSVAKQLRNGTESIAAA